jgi:hypothetical protein
MEAIRSSETTADFNQTTPCQSPEISSLSQISSAEKNSCHPRDGWMDGWVDGRVDGWMNNKTIHASINFIRNVFLRIGD